MSRIKMKKPARDYDSPEPKPGFCGHGIPGDYCNFCMDKFTPKKPAPTKPPPAGVRWTCEEGGILFPG